LVPRIVTPLWILARHSGLWSAACLSRAYSWKLSRVPPDPPSVPARSTSRVSESVSLCTRSKTGPSASAVRPRVAAVSRPDREACCRTLELWNRNLDVESRGRLSAPSLESGSLESAYGGHPGIRVLGFWIVDLRIVPSPPPDRGAPKDLRSF
jgi:hypothetical protein